MQRTPFSGRRGVGAIGFGLLIAVGMLDYVAVEIERTKDAWQ